MALFLGCAAYLRAGEIASLALSRISVALGYYVNPAWFLFTAFVGLNLFQSAFTNWCPMMTILRKLGV